MTFVSVTRLRLRKLRFLPAFAWLAVRSSLQSRRAESNLQTLTLKVRGLVFWTITVWQDQAAMQAFRNSGVHQAAMPRLFVWCDEATYCHWGQADEAVPDLKTAYSRLAADGVVSRVRHPSGNHAARAFPAPKTKPVSM